MTGLVLEGGGIRGAYQIGAYFAFKKCRIKFNAIVGTSIGSFNAAMLVCHKEKELLKFWQSADVAAILGIDAELAELIQNKKINLKLIKGIAGIIREGGLKTQKMRDLVDTMFTEEEVRNSNIDFGLVTLRLSGLKPIEIFKRDIPPGKIKDYILASCYLPVFKFEKIIDSHIYLDGGFYNVLPVSMLVDKKFDTIYAVKLNGLGITKKIKKNESKITYITPSKPLGNTLSLNKEQRLRNIDLGYYDTMRVLKNLDGNTYYFINKNEKYYNFISRNIKRKEFQKIMKYFKSNNKKDTVIKAIEYILKEEKISEFQVYNPWKIIKMIKKEFQKEQYIYQFIQKMKMFI